MPQYLGQHFLKNKNAIDKIVAALDLKKDETIIEIGPGKGALTIPLAKKCAEVGAKLIAIEKDSELIQPLANRVWPLGRDKMKILQGDALKELPGIPKRYTLNTAPFKLVGNIPYYITGNLLRVIGELPVKPETIVLMVQKEVAERVATKPPKMNLLAAATQIWADVEILFTLPATDFDPPPEVESAVIKLGIKALKHENIKTKMQLEKYYQFIHRAFKQPRKTLLNNLCDNIKTKEEMLLELKKIGLNEKTRAQELNIAALASLASKEL